MPESPAGAEAFARATALHEAGRTEEAMQAYRTIPEESPYAFKALNNLGTLLEQAGRLDEAIAVYRRAVALRPDSEALHYNLGFGLHQEGRLDEAVESYRRALQINPGLGLARYNLGNALSQQQQYEAAAAEFRRILDDAPDHLPTLRRLGDALFKLRRLSEALDVYRRALDLSPESAEEHFNVGKALHLLGRPDEAIAAYGRSLELDPKQSAPYENLGRLLSRLGRTREAEELYRWWLTVSPGNPAATHLLAALTGEAIPTRASDDYVRTAFDQFAEDFDATIHRLNYRAPQLLAEALAGIAGPPQRQFAILDAGCGTGLCGPLLAPYARRLVGVDLSSSMLVKARQRGVYDELLDAEITDHLRSAADRYEVIAAADVFVYFGDLAPILQAAFVALRPGGWLLFTLERLDGAAPETDFRLNPHGRYSHSQDYVIRAVSEAGFRVESVGTSALRTEGGEPVQGLVVCAQR